MQATTVRVPGGLRADFDRYEELLRASDADFKRLFARGVIGSLAIIVVGFLVGQFWRPAFVWSAIVLAGFIYESKKPYALRSTEIEAEQARIMLKFHKAGLRICNDPNLRVDVILLA
jgi:hypothetical protein